MEGRNCTSCGEYKSADAFYLNKRRKLRAQCKLCANRQSMNKYQDRRSAEDIAFYASRMASRVIQRCNNEHEVYRYYQENNIKNMFQSHGELKEFLLKEFGQDIKDLLKEGKVPSVDRIDQTGDYRKGNIRIIDFDENRRRGNDTFAIKNSKAVLCVYPDGSEEEFDSVLLAHRGSGVSRTTIRKSFNTGNPTRFGHRFTLIQKEAI